MTAVIFRISLAGETKKNAELKDTSTRGFWAAPSEKAPGGTGFTTV